MSNVSSTFADGGQVVGVVSMVAKLNRAEAGGIAGARRGLGIALHLILQVSSTKVPHEEGDLQRDGAVVVDDAELLGAVTYGNTPDTALYAVRQHEELTWQHDDGREAKFLESAVNASRNQAAAIMADSISKGMAGGGSGE